MYLELNTSYKAIMKYDVFISYRRDGGEYTAKAIHDRLTELGYHVFFDVESLRSGQFNTKLFSVIEECEDFIVVLSPNSLDRCVNENDWVRLEIAYALKKEKNVVPILLRNFQFPDQLPEDMEPLRYRSGIEASTEFFDAFAVRLTQFLKTKPDIVHRMVKNPLLKKVIPLIIALFVVLGITFSGYRFYQTTQASFPYTKSEKNTVKELLYYVTQNFSQADIVISEYDSVLKSFENYLDDTTDTNLMTLQSDLKNGREDIQAAETKYVDLDEALSSKIDDTVLEKDDIIALKDYLMVCTQEMLSNIDYMGFLLSDECLLSKTSMKQIIGDYRQIMDLNKNIIFCGVNDIFVNVDEDALKEFKSTVLITVPYIYDGQEWRTNKEEIKNITDSYFTKYNLIINDITSIVGDLNAETEETESKVNDLETAANELDALKAQAIEKFKPLETDDIGILWGKMLRFNTLQMYDMCVECLEMYHTKDNSEEADLFVPIAEEFFQQFHVTGINYGCIVCGYEPDKPKNSFYQIGDILIELNGKQIKRFDDIAAAKIENQDSKVKVLRYNGTEFSIIEGVIPVNDSLVSFYNMCEKLE